VESPVAALTAVLTVCSDYRQRRIREDPISAFKDAVEFYRGTVHLPNTAGADIRDGEDSRTTSYSLN
jgi:hypothetical protein